MSSLTKENIPHLCRACLRKLDKNENGLIANERKEGPAFYHIDRTNNLHKWMTIINPLEDVTRLKNCEDHKQFPQYVCRSCYENFKHLNDFKEMVVHSFSVLSKLLVNSDEKKATTQKEQPVVESDLIVKSEPIDLDDYNDDDEENDDDDYDEDDYMENDWEMNNEITTNETDGNLLEANLKTIKAAQRKRKYRARIKDDHERDKVIRERQRAWSRQWREKNKIEREKNAKLLELYREKERLRKRRQRENKKLKKLQQQSGQRHKTTGSKKYKNPNATQTQPWIVKTVAPTQIEFLQQHEQSSSDITPNFVEMKPLDHWS